MASHRGSAQYHDELMAVPGVTIASVVWVLWVLQRCTLASAAGGANDSSIAGPLLVCIICIETRRLQKLV